MTQDKKKDIIEVYYALCHRDPAWKEAKMMQKFKVLFDGWRAAELRHKKHTPQFYTLSWRRGWMPEHDFERFKEYAMQ